MFRNSTSDNLIPGQRYKFKKTDIYEAGLNCEGTFVTKSGDNYIFQDVVIINNDNSFNTEKSEMVIPINNFVMLDNRPQFSISSVNLPISPKSYLEMTPIRSSKNGGKSKKSKRRRNKKTTQRRKKKSTLRRHKKSM